MVGPSRKNPLPKAEQSPNGVYYTPGWLVRLWVEYHTPRCPSRIVDVGAGDGRLGEEFGAIWMFDVDPKSQSVAREDLFRPLIVPSPIGAPLSIVSNPPFGDVQRWLLRCLELCGPGGDVSLLLRCGVMQQVSWPVSPKRAVLPKHRVAFEVEEAYALEVNARRARQGKSPSAFRDASVPTGWHLGSPGDDHGIFTFEPEWSGSCDTIYVDCEKYMRPEG